MEKIRLGVIGCGQRGMSMIEGCFTQNPDTVITAVCDRYEDRSRGAAEKVKELTGEAPFAAGDISSRKRYHLPQANINRRHSLWNAA